MILTVYPIHILNTNRATSGLIQFVLSVCFSVYAYNNEYSNSTLCLIGFTPYQANGIDDFSFRTASFVIHLFKKHSLSPYSPD